jgi:hypothetical protein
MAQKVREEVPPSDVRHLMTEHRLQTLGRPLGGRARKHNRRPEEAAGHRKGDLIAHDEVWGMCEFHPVRKLEKGAFPLGTTCPITATNHSERPRHTCRNAEKEKGRTSHPEKDEE